MKSTAFKSVSPTSVLKLLETFGFDTSARAGGSFVPDSLSVVSANNGISLISDSGLAISFVEPALFAKTVYATEDSLQLRLFY